VIHTAGIDISCVLKVCDYLVGNKQSCSNPIGGWALKCWEWNLINNTLMGIPTDPDRKRMQSPHQCFIRTEMWWGDRSPPFFRLDRVNKIPALPMIIKDYFRAVVW